MSCSSTYLADLLFELVTLAVDADLLALGPVDAVEAGAAVVLSLTGHAFATGFAFLSGSRGSEVVHEAEGPGEGEPGWEDSHWAAVDHPKNEKGETVRSDWVTK